MYFRPPQGPQGIELDQLSEDPWGSRHLKTAKILGLDLSPYAIADE
jgi:hypothetical protein